MSRISAIVALSLFASANAFTTPTTSAAFGIQRINMASGDNDDYQMVSKVERGVSVDQDGKSNVWAIEPKVEVETKSSEEKTSSLLIAGGGLAAFAGAAGVILSNLPDPNQF